jgi:Tol biopolymer transport system component
MKLLPVNIFLLFISTFSLAQPASEIYLFDLTIKKNKVTMSDGKNITNHTGYDNQPFFHPKGPVLYYTQADTSGRTDIIAFDYSKNTTKRITKTSEREYSPTLTPDGKFLSCIIQRDDGAQDLGKYPVAGGPPQVLIDNLKVGYHAWVNNAELILFVLGEPNTLRWYSLPNRKDSILAGNIGRSLHAIPGTPAMSFVDKSGENWVIKRLDVRTKVVTDIVNTLPGREDLTWTPDGKLVMSDGEKLFYFHPGVSDSWQEIEGAAAPKLKGITRLSVNKKGDKIAVVAGE